MRKYEEGAEAMGDGGKVTKEYGIYGAETGNYVQGDGSYSVTVQEQELGSDRGDAKGAGGVSKYGGFEGSSDIRSDSQ